MLNLVDDELIQILHENLSDKPSSIRNKQGNVSQLYKFITTMKKAKKMIEQVCFALKQSQAYNKALVIKFEKEIYEQKQFLQNQCATEIEHQSDMFKQRIKELRMEMEEQEIQIQKQSEEKLNKEENYEQQIKQLKRNLNDQRILYENKCAETQDRQEEFEQQLNQQINEWQQKLLNEQIQKDDLESQMERQKSQYGKLKNEKDAEIRNKQILIDNLTDQVTSLQTRLKDNEEEYSKQAVIIREQKNQLAEKQFAIEKLNKQLQDLQKQLDMEKEEAFRLSSINDELNKKNQYLQLEINRNQGQLRQIQLQHDSLQRDYEDSKQSEKELIEINKRMIEDFTTTSAQDMQQSRDEIYLKDLIIHKIITQYQGQQKYIDSIVGPMEKIMNSEYKINKIWEDPNAQKDNTEYILYEIGLDKTKANDYMKNQKWMLLEECLQLENLGIIKTTRSIQPNSDVTFLKGYITVINDAEKLIQKRLLRKEYKFQTTPILQTKEEAAKLSLNNQLCKLLFERYNQELGQPQVQGKQFCLQKQFVIQVKGHERYFYCEMIEEGPFEKINGGNFKVLNSELHQYLNAFSLYTYHLMKQNLIITNLQVVGQYLHDMIVSTSFQIFSPLDQGQSEINKALEILHNAPNASISKFWIDKLETSSKLGW